MMAMTMASTTMNRIASASELWILFFVCDFLPLFTYSKFCHKLECTYKAKSHPNANSMLLRIMSRTPMRKAHLTQYKKVHPVRIIYF